MFALLSFRFLDAGDGDEVTAAFSRRGDVRLTTLAGLRGGDRGIGVLLPWRVSLETALGVFVVGVVKGMVLFAASWFLCPLERPMFAVVVPACRKGACRKGACRG